MAVVYTVHRCNSRGCVKAKFHYTGPTGPARTFSRDPGRIPGSPTKSADFVWSGPVGPVQWNLAITATNRLLDRSIKGGYASSQRSSSWLIVGVQWTPPCMQYSIHVAGSACDQQCTSARVATFTQYYRRAGLPDKHSIPPHTEITARTAFVGSRKSRDTH